jgi:hypothetical protein
VRLSKETRTLSRTVIIPKICVFFKFKEAFGRKTSPAWFYALKQGVFLVPRCNYSVIYVHLRTRNETLALKYDMPLAFPKKVIAPPTAENRDGAMPSISTLA